MSFGDLLIESEKRAERRALEEQRRPLFESWAERQWWFKGLDFSRDADCRAYYHDVVEAAFDSWNAALDNLLIALPRRQYIGNCGDDYYFAPSVDQALTAAGLKVQQP